MSEYQPEDDFRPCSTCNAPGNCHVDSPLNRHEYKPVGIFDVIEVQYGRAAREQAEAEARAYLEAHAPTTPRAVSIDFDDLKHRWERNEREDVTYVWQFVDQLIDLARSQTSTVPDIHAAPGEVMCGRDCGECAYRATLSGCAGQPRATQCTRKVEYAIRPIGHRVPTYRCGQCYCQSVIDRNAAWAERYQMYRLLRELRVERAGGWRSYVMGGRAARAWKRLAKRLRDELDEWKRTARQNLRELEAVKNAPGIFTSDNVQSIHGSCPSCMTRTRVHGKLCPLRDPSETPCVFHSWPMNTTGACMRCGAMPAAEGAITSTDDNLDNHNGDKK